MGADFQHVPYTYLRKHYGTEIHRDMIRLWAGVDETHVKDRLLREGFSINETHVALYSYLARQNLAWLFQSSLPDVSEERIAQAFAILQEAVKPDFELILEDSVMLTIGEPPPNTLPLEAIVTQYLSDRSLKLKPETYSITE